MAKEQELKTPRFAELPLDPTHPPHSAWIWGPEDQLGTLNFLTPAAVRQAASEIQIGERIGLDWPLHLSSVPPGFRERLKHEIFQIGPNVNVSQSARVRKRVRFALVFSFSCAGMASNERNCETGRQA
jgi:hypothetical protein